MCTLFCFLLLGVHSVTCMDACCVENKSERERDAVEVSRCAGDKTSSDYIDCMYCELWVRCGAGDYNLKSPSSRGREHLHTSSAWMVFGPILDALAAREQPRSLDWAA